MEVDVVMSDVLDTEVLMASYVEDNISQDKGRIFDSGSAIQVCSNKDMSTPWLQRRNGLSKWWIARLARSPALGQSILQVEMGSCMLWRQFGMSRRHGTI